MEQATDEGWLDVTVPLRTGLVSWPGDPAFRIEGLSDLALGDCATVSRIDMCVHTGTHMDAPCHYLANGASMAELPLGAVIGPCRVLAVEADAAVTAGELVRHAPRPGERILLRTANSQRSWWDEPFAEDFVHLSPAAAAVLVEQGVRTVGVDYLSVGGFHQGGHETHEILLRAGIWIIEGLNLTAVAAGDYDLVCLPLLIEGGDGSPARAVLRPRSAARRSTAVSG